MAPTPRPYTPAIPSGDFLFCSGQIGLDGDKLVDGFAAQVTQSMANLADLLKAHDRSVLDIVKTTVFITDMSRYDEMNDLYKAALGDHRPARSAVAVAALPLGAEFEIEAIVALTV